MKKAPIIDRLLTLNKENIVSFHVPGHKNGRTYGEFSYKNYQDILYNLDTTEIPGTDNLHNPKDVIMESQKRASRVFNSEETFFLVNGSTSGIYSMIMASTCPGDQILIDRNCHQSVINASILGDLRPTYIYPHIDIEKGISLGICPEDIERELIKNKDIKAVVLTYPNYYGITCDLKKIGEIVHKYDKILLIDEAHGAHLGLSKSLPDTALGCGADAVVQSTHKTLPSFTQSSMLHIQGDRIDREKLKLMLRIHQSSSPSYLLLSSLDFAVHIYETEGPYLMEKLLENMDYLRHELSKIDRIDMMGREIVGSCGVKDIDPTRLWFGIKGISGYELEERLRGEFKIQVELSNHYGVLAIGSIGTKKEDLDQLLDAVYRIAQEDLFEETREEKNYSYKVPKQIFTPREALYRPKRKILLKESINKISGEYIIPYPPGIPIIIPGERINHETLEYVSKMVAEGKEILGLKDISCQWIEVLIED